MTESSKPRMSLASKVLIGLALGVLAGVFFGEKVAFLKVGGDAFVQLMQMTVLPYLSVSLIAGVGRLTQAQALSLARKCGALLLVFWGIGFVAVILCVLAYPNWESASFFSASLAEEPKPTDFLALYIPSNPFYSLANNIVPAVVVFSIAVGIGLIAIERKADFLATLSVVSDALTRVTGMVLELSPLGVFAITASAAGTLDVEDLGRLQVFIVTYALASLVLALWVLPAIVTSCTPLAYREVVRTIQDALVTAFATGSLLIVLPILAERGAALLRQHHPEKPEAASAVEILVPIAFTFPTMGLVLTLGFVPFAAWYVGSPLMPQQYPTFVASAAVSGFGGSYVAVPFLLNLFRIPADLFQLFVAVTVFTSRFATLLACMHIWALTLLGASALTGTLNLRALRLVPVAVSSALLLVLSLGAARLFFTYGLDVEYDKGQAFKEMNLTDATRRLVAEPSRSPAPSTAPPAPAAPAATRLAEIRRRGTLRVGYFDDSLPFAFENQARQLVGHDVEMAHLLALELGVRPEFVRIPREGSGARLDSGECDVLMSGLVATPERAFEMSLVPYMDQTLGFVVEDPRREEFSTWEALRSQARLRIAVPGGAYYRSFLASRLPKAELEEIRSGEEYVKAKQRFDAALLPAETGSAWTLVDPRFSVVVPRPDPVKVPTAYAVPRQAPELAAFVRTWVELARQDGTLARLFDHWILGKGAASREPRWSVIRNVLHWEK